MSIMLSGASLTGAVLLLPSWFQLRLGMGPALTGLFLMSLGLGTAMTVVFAGRPTPTAAVGSIRRRAHRAGERGPWPWLGPDTSMVVVQVLLFVRGAGLGMSMMPAMPAMPAMSAAYAAARAEDLGDATALANIFMRVGGALGGALCVVALSRGLADGANDGFGGAFTVLTVVGVLAAVSAAWLRHAELHLRGKTRTDVLEGKK
ncbi:hypothetical protein [Amycolatopsis sp. H20-H5]|uniref:hypothetical protein n=1 Tax=Amycolatopsis sp. H20-H5 TaxID=3046309 RepID=UPI002DBE4E1E|nr:hypothetical protein [Amycolatopsis sp. H20-H5]MEC3975562.1 hypothetical protein [Amycolatopsis sp. H20-H5]